MIGRAWVAATVGDERGARNLFEQAADDSEQRGLLPYALFASARSRASTAPRPSRHASPALPSRSTARWRRRRRPTHTGSQLTIPSRSRSAANSSSSSVCGSSPPRAQLPPREPTKYEARPPTPSRPRPMRNARRPLRRCPADHLERLQTPSPLTARERQIARLAALGCTTRDIASQLNVSVRTIDSHLAHAYTKLGVKSRRDLASHSVSPTTSPIHPRARADSLIGRARPVMPNFSCTHRVRRLRAE